MNDTDTLADDLRKDSLALMKLLADEKHKSEALAEKLRETEIRLRMYGGHTANCAYHQGHYKGPASQCDCMWTDLVPSVFAAQREVAK